VTPHVALCAFFAGGADSTPKKVFDQI